MSDDVMAVAVGERLLVGSSFDLGFLAGHHISNEALMSGHDDHMQRTAQGNCYCEFGGQEATITRTGCGATIVIASCDGCEVKEPHLAVAVDVKGHGA